MAQPPSVAPPAALAAALAERAAADQALVVAAQAGDRPAFEALVARYRGRVHRVVLAMTKSAAEAEEVVQETFLSVFRHLDAYRPGHAVSAWIYRIAVNAALMRLRTRRRKPLLALEDHGVPQNDPQAEVPFWPASSWALPPEQQVVASERAGALEATIARLPEKYRLVLLLRDLEGQGNEEVAEALGLTVPTVKARLHRARAFVRHELGTPHP